MTIPDLRMVEMLACGLATAILILSVVVFFLRPRRSAPIVQVCECEAFREAMENHQTACAQHFLALSRRLDSAEAAMLDLTAKRSDNIVDEGRLNMSARAQALQLLRAGIAPDTAAFTLGVPTRDIRLLAKVAKLLATN
jgi:hypothetical protein